MASVSSSLLLLRPRDFEELDFGIGALFDGGALLRVQFSKRVVAWDGADQLGLEQGGLGQSVLGADGSNNADHIRSTGPQWACGRDVNPGQSQAHTRKSHCGTRLGR